MDNYVEKTNLEGPDSEADKELNVTSSTQAREDSFESLEINSDKNEKKEMLNIKVKEEYSIPFKFYKKLGSVYTFFHYKGNPLIVIGPHCMVYL
jgi:hypothetical protein